MNYAQIRSMDISNGEGVGVSIFVQGCPIHCKGCFNSDNNIYVQYYDREYGINEVVEKIDKVINEVINETC